MASLQLAFDLALAHGRCVGVAIPDGAELDAMAAALRPEERALGEGWALPRRRTWVGGRTALRAALERAGLGAPAVLQDDRGAPEVPAGMSASVSHKDHLAVALVAAEPAARIGVDVEIPKATRVDIARRVLTATELAEVDALPSAERAEQVLLRFSVKEAIYKAIDPFVRRYVGFQEVAVQPRPDGTVAVTTMLPEGPLRCEARWLRVGAAIVTTARAQR